MNRASSTHFDRQYQRHVKHLKLKGLQPKTIEAYARAIRRIGKRCSATIRFAGGDNYICRLRGSDAVALERSLSCRSLWEWP